MTLRDEQPVRRCAVRGCPYLGRWPEGGVCREHRDNPLTDNPSGRTPTLLEAWDTDERITDV